MTDLLGQTIANRRLDALLGSGELGQVFRARHLGLDREEALKLIHPAVASVPGFAERFAQEMGAIEQLDHTHIIEIFGAGEENGHCYLTMEFMNPGSLGIALERRARDPQSMPLTVGLDIIRQAADGLAIAHSKGHVHRNIKPNNILLSQQSASDGTSSGLLVKISDFGLKPSNEIAATPTTDLGTAPAILPIYWSPEQFVEPELDGRSDLYSLGMVLYELATGLLPFSIKSFDLAGITHLRTPPRPPREVRPELPPTLEAIILRCLAKQPDDRFASAKELSDALQTVIQDLKLTEPSPPKASLTPPVIDGPREPSTLPRVQIVDQQGKPVLPVQDLTGDGLTVGRRNSDIVLDDPAVAEQHALIDWDGIQAHVTDYGSASGTFLGKTQLQPQASQAWNWGQFVRIGPFWMRLEAPSASIPASTNGHKTVIAPPVPTPGYTLKPALSPMTTPASNISRPNPVAVLGTHINVILEEQILTLTPGQHAVCVLTIINKGDQVHHLHINVNGVPTAWVRGPDKPPQLNPTGQTVVTLNIFVPRVPESKARQYPVMVQVRSEDTPDEVGVAPATWTVLPFAESTMSVPKKRRRGWRRGRYTVAIRNEGNSPDRYTISGSDEEEVLGYEAEPDQMTLKEGESKRAILTAQAPMYWFGRPQRHDLKVQVKPEAEGDSKIERVQFLQRAIVPMWAIPVAIVLLLLTAGLVYLLTRPEITDIKLDKEPAVLGEQTNGYVLFKNGQGSLQANDSPVRLRMTDTNTYTQTGSYNFTPDHPGQTILRLLVTNRFRISVERTKVVEVVTPTATSTATPIPSNTPLPTRPSPTDKPTSTQVPSPTFTPIPSITLTASATSTATATATADNVLSCVNGSSTAVSGRDPYANGRPMPLLVYFIQTHSDGSTTERSITGGTTDANGYFNIPIAVQNQPAGYHSIIVRERYTGKEVRSFSCPVPATPSRTPLVAPTSATPAPK